MDLLVLWSVAVGCGALDSVQKSGPERTGEVAAVCAFGVRNSWGSGAKFYRLLKEWRDITEMESPGVVLERVQLAKERKAAMVQALSLTAVQVGVA
jgi:hypothetical protein